MGGREISAEGELQAVYRLADANLNRCREGLRVLEDTARFIWNDRKVFRVFRGERHALDKLSRKIYPRLVDSRNSGSDEGRTLREGGRENLGSVLTANFRRCEESLRALEEFGKLFSARAAGRFKEMRFRMYDLEKECGKRNSHASSRKN